MNIQEMLSNVLRSSQENLTVLNFALLFPRIFQTDQTRTANYSRYSPHIKSSLFRTFYTVQPRPKKHPDMILFEVFMKSIDLIAQQQILHSALFIL